eukprot:gi/632989410/ref/XP_007883633.1/ PREDICTED: chemokine-like receptor 1 [Callorhinchus milii]
MTSAPQNSTVFFAGEEWEEEEDGSFLLGGLSGVHVLSMVIYCLACVLGVAGNGAVIWVTAFRMKRTINTVWFLNLALADFAFTASLPLSVAYMALGFHWPFGRVACKMAAWLNSLNMFASVFLLAAVSLDRCLSVSCPVWSQNHRGSRAAWGAGLLCWGAAVAASLPTAVFREVLRHGNRTVCFNDYMAGLDWEAAESEEEQEEIWGAAEARHNAVVLATFVLGYLAPLVAILTCYTIIWQRLGGLAHVGRSSKPYRVIVAVVTAFFLCWTPHHVFKLLELFQVQGKATELGIPIATSLAFANSCVNPFLYVFVGRDFRQRLSRSSTRDPLERALGTGVSVQSYTGSRSKTKVSLVPTSEEASEAV